MYYNIIRLKPGNISRRYSPNIHKGKCRQYKSMWDSDIYYRNCW